MAASKLDDILRRFAAEIETVVRDEVTAHVLGALSGKALSSGGTRGNSRGPSGPARKGAKRAPEDLECLTEQLRVYIGKHPGERIEQVTVYDLPRRS